MNNKIIEINGKKYKRVEVNETPLWEQEIDENWFSDLSAKAKQAYIKTNPNSKYAKDVKSGKKEAPETEKQKKTRQSKEADDKAEKKASSARQALFSKQRSRARGNRDSQYPF